MPYARAIPARGRYDTADEPAAATGLGRYYYRIPQGLFAHLLAGVPKRKAWKPVLSFARPVVKMGITRYTIIIREFHEHFKPIACSCRFVVEPGRCHRLFQ